MKDLKQSKRKQLEEEDGKNKYFLLVIKFPPMSGYIEDSFEIDDIDQKVSEKRDKLFTDIAGTNEIRDFKGKVVDSSKTFKELGYKKGDELIIRKYITKSNKFVQTEEK